MWFIRSPPFSWPSCWSVAVEDLRRSNRISMMVWALICVIEGDLHTCKTTEQTCLTRLEGVHVTPEMQHRFRNVQIFAAMRALLTCPGGVFTEMCCWCGSVLAGSSHFFACTVLDGKRHGMVKQSKRETERVALDVNAFPPPVKIFNTPCHIFMAVTSTVQAAHCCGFPSSHFLHHSVNHRVSSHEAYM